MKKDISERPPVICGKGIDIALQIEKIQSGFDINRNYLKQKKVVLKELEGSYEDWENWRWHVKNSIVATSQLANILGLTEILQQEIDAVAKIYPWKITPYYLALMDPNDKHCPLRQQAIPDIREIQDQGGDPDPLNETGYSPIPGITRRYPDRLILNVVNNCATYCRHCQRRRNISNKAEGFAPDKVERALGYIRGNKEIRDVLLTGGDPLMLPDDRIEWLLDEVSKISHVKIKRIGSRLPVTLPQRITPKLCKILKKHSPIYLNTQFNHPREVTPTAAKACSRLLKAGVILGNQTVLLKGINNDANIMRKLNIELLKIGVRPYYLFYKQQTSGTRHFATSIEEGIAIMEQLRGHISGLAIPTFVVNAPGGFGKIPLAPNYWLSAGEGYVTLRSWDGFIINVPNHSKEV